MKTKLIISGWIALFLSALPVHADPIEEGKAIFMSRCAGCHNVNKTLTGPALAGVDQRRNIDWIIQFVRSSQTLVRKGDEQAVAVFEQFRKIPMPDHTDLTNEHIKSIVDYIKSEAVNTDAKAPFAKPSKQQKKYLPLSLKNDYMLFIGYLFAVALLIVVLLFVVRLKSFPDHAGK
jgi:mono/diheme cytochrome c family protein